MPITADERVAKYIQETPELMQIAERCVQESPTRSAAARQFMEIVLASLQQSKTPSGDPYSKYAFKLAVRLRRNGNF